MTVLILEIIMDRAIFLTMNLLPDTILLTKHTCHKYNYRLLTLLKKRPNNSILIM